MKFLSSTLYRLRHIILVSGISLSVMSCGGGAIATAGISGTGIVFGAITGFGSIFVNGVEYETDNATFNVDGEIVTSQDQLKIGMVVKLETTAFDNGTFEADNVVYDDSIEGPITSTVDPVPGQSDKKEFTVLGVQVVVSASTTSFHDSSTGVPAVSFETLAQRDVIEVSGFVDSTSGKINATLIEKKDELPSSGTIPPVPVEIHVTVPDPAPAPGPTGSFSVLGLTVNYDANTVFDDVPNDLLVPGLAIEVKGLFDSATDTIQANEIEGEDDDGVLGSGGSGSSPISLSLQGLIVGIDVTQTMFSINSIPVEVDASVVSADIINQLVEGMNVEVEGVVENGVLKADQLEIREGNSEFKAFVQSRDLTAQTLNIAFPGVTGSILLQLDSQSIIEDENRSPITLSDILVGDDVKVKARELNDEWRVISLKRKRNEPDSYEISGEIDAIDPTNTITIDGLTFQLDQINPVIYDPLLTGSPNLAVGTLVELEDKGMDGDIDEVSVYIP